jgi:hypothetical protein
MLLYRRNRQGRKEGAENQADDVVRRAVRIGAGNRGWTPRLNARAIHGYHA